MIETESFRSEAHFSPKSETELENETERDCGITLRLILGFYFTSKNLLVKLHLLVKTAFTSKIGTM